MLTCWRYRILAVTGRHSLLRVDSNTAPLTENNLNGEGDHH